MKKIKFFENKNAVRILLLILGSIFTTLVLAFAIMAMVKIREEDYHASSGYLLSIFIVLAFSRLTTFIKERTKISFLRLVVLLVFDVALGLIIFFGKDNPRLYFICSGLFCVTIIVSRIFKIIQNHSIRSIILNAIIITIAGLLAIGLFIPGEYDDIFSPVVILCTIVAITAFLEVLSSTMYQLKFKVLGQIIIRTYALEIILGLVTMIVAASLVFMYFEDSIPSFGDALWYSFAVVTTIGFGDFTALTIIGRITTVVLGIYGIIVVAVITSIIVNFYNETAGSKDSKELKQIHKESEKKK